MKRFLPYLFYLLCSSLLLPATAQRSLRLQSPNGKIGYTLNTASGRLNYTIDFNQDRLLDPSPLGLIFNDQKSNSVPARWSKSERRKLDEQYDLIIGKNSHVRSQCNELRVSLPKSSVAGLNTVLVVRAFNDGIAFRYEIPEQDGIKHYSITEENTGFNLAGNPDVHTLFFANQFSSHEGFYANLPLAKISADSLLDLPALFVQNGKNYIAITEASLRNYAGMYLKQQDGILKTWLSPLPGQTTIKVKADLPHQSPWRVLLIGKDPATLMESNIITSLNEAPPALDYSWIKPGKTSFHWWNGDIVPDTSFEAGANFMTNRYYIDFCARNNIQYHSVIGYAGQPWYINDGGANYQPGPGTDITRTIPNINMPEICSYAKSKGVGIHVWVHWKALYPKLDTAFALFEKWGINGMMVDFMDRDDQEMVNIQEEILQKAVKHHLFIQFHGAFKPTGLHRTYPSEFTREGTYNYEQNKWSSFPVSADHDIMMPFTRVLAGTTDYHLGGFRAVPRSEWKTQFSRPLMDGTRAHMLGMYLVMESYLVSLCDYPQAYEGQEGFDFLKQVPTTWDETKVPAAVLGQYVVTARRKGKDWWLGSINNSSGRSVTIPLVFLEDGQYEAVIWEDGPDAASHPNLIQKRTVSITNKGKIDLQLAASGGAVIHFKRI